MIYSKPHLSTRLQNLPLNGNAPKTAIVVLNYNDLEETTLCIESLKKCSYKNLLIFVVDNASPDGSGRLLKEMYPEISFLLSPVNGGYAAGMNIGIKKALEVGSKYVIILNNDTIVDAGFVEPLVIAAESDKSIGLISPKVLYQEQPELVYCAGADLNHFLCVPRSHGKMRRADKYGIVREEKSTAEGACIFMTRKVIETIGYFSEKYFLYYEDLDFAQKVRKKYKILFEPDSIVYHRSGSGMTWTKHTNLYHYYFTRNRLLFFSTYNLPYRLYVFFYAFINVITKSFVLFISRLKGDKSNLRTSLKYLWSGYFDGIKLLMHITKPKNDEPLIKEFSN